jgi:pyrroline-5-carboxylate reductase
MKTIGFIGGGRITRIFLEAYARAGMPVTSIAVFDPSAEAIERIKTRYPDVGVTNSDFDRVAGADIVFLAVHPPLIADTLLKMKEIVKKDALVVSLAPKVTIDQMAAILFPVGNIARINPSASSYINRGLNPVCFGRGMDEQYKNVLRELMKPLGSLPEVEEPKIEAYAMISAMGHTYFWFQLRKLEQLATEFGMDPQEAKNTVEEMMAGTTATLYHSGLAYDEVSDLVPVKPLKPAEDTILGYYDENLIPLFGKIKP